MTDPFSKNSIPALIGVVHLLPLPGNPRPSPGLDRVIDRACADARALAEGGVDSIIVENLGDTPFSAGAVDPYTVAAMTRIALAIAQEIPHIPLGINVLRNDARSALGIATAVNARYIRVNVHTGSMVTDQGLIHGDARNTLLERLRLSSSANIAADVLVKHAVPLGTPDLAQVAHDTWERGGVQALIVSGTGTGKPIHPPDLEEVRRVAPLAPLWVGSGTTPENAPILIGRADAAIVGTWLHAQGDLNAPIDVARVRTIRQIFQ